MTTTKEIQNGTKSLKKVKNTLFEMLGPQSDGFEESKLNLLLGMDTCGNMNTDRDRLKKNQSNLELIAEDASTAECNLSSKEICKKSEENKASPNFANVEESSMTVEHKLKNFMEENHFDVKSNNNPNIPLTKSAFRAIKEKNSEVNCNHQTSSPFPRQAESSLPNNYFSNSVNSFVSVNSSNRLARKHSGNDGNQNVYSLNLTTNNYNHTNSNNYQNNNFQNNSSSKQILFTSIKNNYKKEKKSASQVNFQIIKTNQNCENSAPVNNKNYEPRSERVPGLKYEITSNENLTPANGQDNTMLLGGLSTNLNSNVSVNVNSNSSSSQSNCEHNQNILHPTENVTQNEVQKEMLIQYNEQKQKNSSESKFSNHNVSSNLFKENSYLKFLIIAAETLLSKGFQFLDDVQPIEKESTATVIITNQLITKANEGTVDNLKAKLDSSENHDSPSIKSAISYTKLSPYKKSEQNTNDSLRKCDNKVCGVLALKKLGWFKVKITRTKSCWYCKACYKAWKNNQFCYYCNVIYRDNTNATNYTDNKSWIQCDYCEMWQHIQCEETKGCYPELSELNSDPNFKYVCPLCRVRNESVSNDFNSNVTGDKRKNKHKNKKNANGIIHDFLGNKTKHDKELDHNQVSSSKRSKKKDVNSQMNEPGPVNKDFNITNGNGISSYSLFSSYDNRDIYHDLYRISAINEERKK